MERRPALVRRAFLAALALLLVAAGAGCSDSDRVGTRTAASVGDVDITQDQVVALMQGQIAYAERLEAATKKAAKASPDDATAQQQVEQASSTRQQITETFAGTGAQAGTDSVGTEGAAQVLSTMIQVELMKQAARDAGVKVSDSEIADARTSMLLDRPPPLTTASYRFATRAQSTTLAHASTYSPFRFMYCR